MVILPLLFSLFILFFSLRRGFVLKYRTANGTKSLPMQELKKKGEIGKLIHYLMENKHTKFKTTVKFEKPRS